MQCKMCHRMSYTILLLSLQWIVSINGNPTGAPSGACLRMVPAHGVDAQSSSPPYTIHVSDTNMTAGGTIQVTISESAGVPFKGFLLQARRADPSLDQDEAIGTFETVAGAQLTCQEKGLTHILNDEKTTMGPITWTAPDTLPGHIEFRVTIVQHQTTFWVNVKSDIIMDPTAPAITTPVPSSVEALVKPVNSKSCGMTKSCVSFPPKCIDDCDVIATWTKPDRNNQIYFEVEAETDGWVSLGFSNTMFMTNTSATACAWDGQTVLVDQMWIDKYDLPDTVTTNTGLSAESGTMHDGRLTCRFTRNVSVANNQVFDLNNEAFIIIAHGHAVAGAINKHHELPCVTRTRMNLLKDTFIHTGIDMYKSAIVRTHGIMMTLAWMFCVSVAILMARYFKEGSLKEKWFQIHRFLQVMTISLTLLAFVIIFIEARGYTLVGKDPHNPLYLQAHAPLGIIVMVLTITNVIMAIFRPHPGEKKRNIFNWAHWIVGTTAHICGIIAIFIGIGMPKAKPLVQDWTFYVLIAFVVVHVLGVLLLEIGRCCNQKKQLSNIRKYERMSDSFSTNGDNGPRPGSEDYDIGRFDGNGKLEEDKEVSETKLDEIDGPRPIKVVMRQNGPLRPQAVKLADMFHKYIILVLYAIFVFCLALIVIITLATA